MATKKAAASAPAAPIAASKSEKAASATKVALKLADFGIGELTDLLHESREKKRALDEQIKLIEAEYAEIETRIFEQMAKQGTDLVRGKKATASITTSISADVQDWEELNKFIKRTGNFQLYQRRLSDPAFRELLEKKGGVPGVASFTKKRLNLRVL